MLEVAKSRFYEINYFFRKYNFFLHEQLFITSNIQHPTFHFFLSGLHSTLPQGHGDDARYAFICATCFNDGAYLIVIVAGRSGGHPWVRCLRVICKAFARNSSRGLFVKGACNPTSIYIFTIGAD
jgi:hypothetical protein